MFCLKIEEGQDIQILFVILEAIIPILFNLYHDSLLGGHEELLKCIFIKEQFEVPRLFDRLQHIKHQVNDVN